MIMRVLSAVPALFLLSFYMGCSPSKKTAVPVGANPNKTHAEIDKYMNEGFFNSLFRDNQGFDSILANRENWNIQVIYTMIDRNAKNAPLLTTYRFNTNPKYFYPASSVKLPIALLALEKLNDLKKKGIDKYTSMLTEAGYSGQTPVYNDPNSPDGRPTIAQYIKKIFLVSDNDAANRLYEFLGQEYINAALHKKGYTEAQILHRLGIFLSEDENRVTNPVNFYDSAGKLLYSQPLQRNTAQYEVRNDTLGKGYYSKGELINHPMDFSKKNRISLGSLHEILIGLVFPDKTKRSHRFNITDDDRHFVLKQMSQFPGESLFPSYDSNEYHDGYDKFLLYGSEKGNLPKHIRVFNKVGNAYGQLVDVAYIVDFEKKIEFFVSAAITCNTDEILNDDKYDYYTTGFPFLKNLGRVLYQHELKRERKVQPDLSAFMFTYDK